METDCTVCGFSSTTSRIMLWVAELNKHVPDRLCRVCYQWYIIAFHTGKVKKPHRSLWEKYHGR